MFYAVWTGYSSTWMTCLWQARIKMKISTSCMPVHLITGKWPHCVSSKMSFQAELAQLPQTQHGHGWHATTPLQADNGQGIPQILNSLPTWALSGSNKLLSSLSPMGYHHPSPLHQMCHTHKGKALHWILDTECLCQGYYEGSCCHWHCWQWCSQKTIATSVTAHSAMNIHYYV